MLLEWVLAGIAILGKLVAAEVETSNIIYDSRYTILNEAAVGEGLGTVIRIAERLSDAQIFAAKFFDPIDEWYEEMLRREFAFGHFFEHENIARSIEIVEASPTACIIMEYFPTEMLNVLVSGELSIWKVDKMFKQILSGVAHMHSLGVAHRDLKMDNVLLDENGDAKIIDFGRSSFARGMITGEVILAYGLWGSYPFSAPECHEDKKYDPIQADIWSLGVLYISMIIGDLPWDSATADDKTFAQFLSPGGRASLLKLIPLDSRLLISNMLSLNPLQRPKMINVFANPWIRNILL